MTLDFDTITDLQIASATMAADRLAREGVAKLATLDSPRAREALAELDRNVVASAKRHGVADRNHVHSLRMGAAIAFGVRLADHAEGVAQ